MSDSGEVLILNVEDDEERALEQAATLLRQGELVAFPTETVYGLGARADRDDAVRKIYEAKGRPATNPLIVHVASVSAARELAQVWSDEAESLAQAFWPGPLTLIVEGREDVVSDGLRAGLSTLAIRVPGHDVARRLIEAVGAPVAAPSANRYTELSPTTASHVLRGLGDRVAAIVDGGATQVGLESTLVDARRSPVKVARPGMISVQEMMEVVDVAEFRLGEVVQEEAARPSPGLSKKHYSPQTPLRIVDKLELQDVADREVGVIRLGEGEVETRSGGRELVLPNRACDYGRELYAALHRLDRRGLEQIWVEAPPRGGEWQAVWDRLGRAAARALSDHAQ